MGICPPVGPLKTSSVDVSQTTDHIHYVGHTHTHLIRGMWTCPKAHTLFSMLDTLKKTLHMAS